MGKRGSLLHFLEGFGTIQIIFVCNNSNRTSSFEETTVFSSETSIPILPSGFHTAMQLCQLMLISDAIIQNAHLHACVE